MTQNTKVVIGGVETHKAVHVAVVMKDRDAVVGGLPALAREDANLDVKALTGHPGWYRLRVGNWQVLYYGDPPGIVIERIVNRRELERAVNTL